MRKLFLVGLFLFGTISLWGITESELYDEIAAWEKECYQPQSKSTPNPSSQTNFFTERFWRIAGYGPEIIPYIVAKRKAGDSTVGIFLPEITKMSAKSRFDYNKKAYVWEDYPEFQYVPKYLWPAMGIQEQKNIWVYWWDEGRKLTPQLFAKKYADCQSAKAGGKEEEIKPIYRGPSRISDEEFKAWTSTGRVPKVGKITPRDKPFRPETSRSDEELFALLEEAKPKAPDEPRKHAGLTWDELLEVMSSPGPAVPPSGKGKGPKDV